MPSPTLAELTFWSSLALVVYAYAGYPAVLALIARVRTRPVRRAPIRPRVSYVIAAHNEEDQIAAKIENTLAQRYPAPALEIIVASDCSTDRTDAIVRSYHDRVRLVRTPARGGKEAAQQLAVQAASGDVLVFSDVATRLAPEGVATIVRNFADPTVGCVSSIDRLIDADGTVSGEGAYVRYEMWLRRLETRVNSLVGLSGSFFAVRREICRHWAPDRQSDFSTLLAAMRIGLRGVLDPESVGYYRNLADERREFQRKVRTVVRGLAVLAAHRRMLDPFEYGLFAWQLASHKVCRWLVPFAMIAAGASNAVLWPQSAIYRVAFLLQCGFYAAAIGGPWIGGAVARVPRFLVVANVAVLTAWFRHLRGDRITSWAPSERRESPGSDASPAPSSLIGAQENGP